MPGVLPEAPNDFQQPEIRSPLAVKHHGLAIDGHRRRPKRPGSFCNCRKPMRPVMATTGQDPDALRFDMHRQAVAISSQRAARPESKGSFSAIGSFHGS